ncbi:putative ABC transport system permease protein [Micromonospora viridifaciens]|uniref:Putative ABC transport system permease protein n=1 Tax=Micromonospora viridifaciens TaxID=1881 RepID=A0A1C4WVV2_MICVI|nr:ABC transporter permease [Micromonospora viridifaciens]SCF00386.1 putative ABC transport system permease protein [Micromonospora viridifaciens]
MIRLSGRFRSALIIGGQGIRARKARTLLSMVSLFLGVLAVVVVQVGAETAKNARLADLELHVGKDGTRQAYLPGNADTIQISQDTLKGRTDAVAVSTTQAIIGEPSVSPVNPGGAPFDQPGGGPYAGPGGVEMNCDSRGYCQPIPATGDGPIVPVSGKAIELSLNALTGDIRQFRPFRSVSGQWLDFSSDPSLSPRLVINREAAKGFTRHQVPAEMRVDGAVANPTPRIIGVIDDGNPQPTAYTRADELQNWVPRASNGGDYGAGLQVMLAPTASDVEQLLRIRLTASGMPAEQIYFDTIQARKDIAEELALIRWIFLGMAGLVLLIGVAGILNVGLATVGERVEEFALRRAVGTSRSLLAGIVLAETLLTGLLTAAAAIGLSALALTAISALFGDREQILEDLVFPWQAGAAGVIAGLAAGLLGGLIPAIRAARIPIATVMRA